MFLIAKDLSQMQVWSSVSEADMGRIHVGTPVRFTVDAFSDETFEGKVAQIRLDATVSQNVVTYTIVVSTDNSNRRLLPYLTANLKFEYDRRDNVLVVPNAALRWRPRLPSQIAPDAREDATSGTSASEGGRKTASADGAPNAADGKKSDKSRENRDRLWVKEGDFVRPLEVQTGLTDGSVTEVSGEGVKEELQVVMGESRSAAGDVGDAKNPFLPTIRPGMRPR
jgi:HlyD family secretion protein